MTDLHTGRFGPGKEVIRGSLTPSTSLLLTPVSHSFTKEESTCSSLSECHLVISKPKATIRPAAQEHSTWVARASWSNLEQSADVRKGIPTLSGTLKNRLAEELVLTRGHPAFQPSISRPIERLPNSTGTQAEGGSAWDASFLIH